MIPTTYATVAEYMADVVAAREAYAADRTVAAGLCETGDGHKRDTSARSRRCWMCRHGQGRKS